MYLITGPQSPGVKSQMILSIEHHVDMIADLIEKMRTDGSRRVVPANPAQEDWVVENNNVANMTLYPAAASWYMGANIPGKPRVFMPYVAGVKQYRATCAEIVADNWRGFEFSP
jgi:cyclohexanone monooxygenase